MKRNRFILLIVVCIFFASCRQDISGTYKAINPSDQFEKELILKSATIIQYTIKGRFMSR